MARDVLPNDVFVGVDFRGTQPWSGGGTKLPAGKYRFKLIRHELPDNSEKPKVIAVHEVISGPNDTNEAKGRPYDEYFDLGPEAKGKWMGFIEALVPPAGRGSYNVQLQNGQISPNLAWVNGAIFDAFIDTRSYQGKEYCQINASTIQLVQPAPFADQQLRTVGQQRVAGVPAGVPNNGQQQQPTGNQPIGQTYQMPAR